MKSQNTAETNETFDKRKYDLQWVSKTRNA